MTPSTYLPFARPTLDEATIADVGDVLRSGWITSGPKVAAFESALGVLAGERPVRVVSSATGALEIALRVCGIGPGDEVLTASMTFFAAPNMIVKVGATPVFVDVLPGTRNIDVDAAEARIGPRTKAIMPTHFAGLPCDMDALYALAKRRNLRVIEDCALAIGSSWKGKALGSFGDICVWSFHPNKNITSIEGGALVLNDAREAAAVETMRFHGIHRLPDGTRDVKESSGKYNLPDVNAAVGLRQLARLAEFNAKRRALVARYFERFRTDPACELPHPGYPGDGVGHSWNMFAPLLPLRDLRVSRQQFREAMEARGIGTGVSYEAAHLATAFRRFGYHRGDLPHTERIADTTVTLPLFPTMTDDDVDRVCEACTEILSEHRK
ncbi:MAG: DegT/DnrJ/EryC1/StrS aminotransferase family protein [Casimicrobiaceae bacterium]|jgi:dTDP-4-amino-4,6-dideoxygalactose transaminase